MADEQSPYAEAAALHAAGAGTDAIVDRLRSRGLDEQAIALLLNAVGAKVLQGPLPASAPGRAATPIATPLMQPGTSVCPRCGVFLESHAWEPVLGKAYCRSCAARPDVNYPRAFRDAYWGKRDGWAWFIGATGLLTLPVIGLTLSTNLGLALVLMVSTIGSLLFWSGAKVGRIALVATTVLTAVLSVAQGQAPNIFGIVFTLMAMNNTRTKLFFELEVPEADLAAAWKAMNDNRAAQYSRALGLIAAATMLTWMGSWKFAVVTAVLGSLATALGIIGLRNVQPDAVPPVGFKGAAIVGVVAGGVSLVAALIYVFMTTTVIG